MRMIKFNGYAGNGQAEQAENEAMGLIVDKRYAIKRYTSCCMDIEGKDCGYLVPIVSNENGEEQMLIGNEYTEEDDV